MSYPLEESDALALWNIWREATDEGLKPAPPFFQQWARPLAR